MKQSLLPCPCTDSMLFINKQRYVNVTAYMRNAVKHLNVTLRVVCFEPDTFVVRDLNSAFTYCHQTEYPMTKNDRHATSFECEQHTCVRPVCITNTISWSYMFVTRLNLMKILTNIGEVCGKYLVVPSWVTQGYKLNLDLVQKHGSCSSVICEKKFQTQNELLLAV